MPVAPRGSVELLGEALTSQYRREGVEQSLEAEPTGLGKRRPPDGAGSTL